MFKIIGMLLGMEYEEIKYDREILIFMIVGAVIFLFLGVSHTENGAKFLYTNKLSRTIMLRSEKEGISSEVVDKEIYDFKEAIPVNTREFELYDIKDRLENYIEELKSQENTSLNNIINKLENISKVDNKDKLIRELEGINIKSMLTEVSKEEIVKKKLKEAAEWQSNIFLSNIYFIFGTLLGFSSIIVRVVYEVKLIDKRDKSLKEKEQIL
ncbi:hypothetical protein GOM49_15440 [Clostridium bovifaecis]|uniref:Uncharacterized protein n=1 Tax=Clostridium bovifaecis TaxID=2184719 RepID=A0A6I6ERD2_9CLOT|nr:hypothetical protein GOM49_15440 [Clostridium bovifaecis]